jgi:hypothetical protein
VGEVEEGMTSLSLYPGSSRVPKIVHKSVIETGELKREAAIYKLCEQFLFWKGAIVPKRLRWVVMKKDAQPIMRRRIFTQSGQAR